MKKILRPLLALALILLASTLTMLALSACKAGGGGGSSSQPVKPVAPPPPTALQINVGNAQITATWQPVKGATQYNLYYAKQSFTSLRNPPSGYRTLRGGAMASNITSTSHTLTGLNNGDTYYLVLTAKNSSGESKISPQASATPGQVGMTFQDALKNGGKGPQMVVLPVATATSAIHVAPAESQPGHLAGLNTPADQRNTAVPLTPGRFQMGSASTETGRDRDEGPLRTVTISRSIAMSKHEITFAEYQRFITATGQPRPADQGWGRDKRPVININWNQAKAYAAWLSAQTGKPYRLPSEAEWEYAARAGAATAYSWGDAIHCRQANYARSPGSPCNTDSNNALARTLAVGRFAANAFGLHDLHGNVAEWVEDCWHNTYRNAPTDSRAWTTANDGDCAFRVIRGGAWNDAAPAVRAASRDTRALATTDSALGIRLVQDLTPQPPVPTTVPNAPASLQVSAGNAQATAAWAPVSDAITYTLYYSQSTISDLNASGVTRVANLVGVSHTITGLTNGTTYYFVVTATNTIGQSTASPQDNATPQAPTTVPSAPASLQVSAGDARAVASWAAVTGASRYTLYYSTSSLDGVTNLSGSGITAVTNLTGASATVTGLTNDTQYYFVVTATNAAGQSAASSQASATPRAVPNTPASPTLSPGNARVEASWSAVTGATQYTLYYSTSSLANVTDLTAAGITRIENLTGTSRTVTELTNGTRYYFVITAANASGQSAASSEASTTPQAPPRTPADLSLTAGNAQVTANWSAVTRATGYTLYYATSSISDITALGVRSVSVTGASTTTATATGLTNGTRYYFRVTATNAGGESAASSEASATPQVPVPGAPGALSLSAGNAQVAASWTAVSGATSYTLYYSESSISTLTAAGVTRVANVTSPHTVTSLTNGTQYYFRVTATNAGGESAASTEQSATPQVPAPGAPTNLSLSAGDTQVAASWNAVSGATRYTLYYSESSISDLTAAGVTAVPNLTGTSRTVTSLTNGTLYYFRVTASNARGEGAASTEASATPQVPTPGPGAPSGLTLTAGNAQVEVSWNAVSGATGYTLYYSESSISDLTAAGVTAVPNLTGTSRTVTSLTNGTLYYFRVTAGNARGEGAASSEASATPQVPAPGAPINLSLTAGNAQVEASWSAVSGATGYTLYYSESSISDLTAAGVTAVPNLTGTSRTVTSLTNGTLYYFRVTAGNAGGQSAASDEASATPRVPAPGTPTNLSLTAGNTQVAASWNAVRGATSYTLYYSTASITSLTATGVTAVPNLTGTSHTVTSLTNGTLYYFRVMARNAGGQSTASTEASATPQASAPGAPTNLSLTAGSAQVTARWSAVANAGRYTLYYSESTISTLTATGVTSVPNLTGTSHTVSGLTNGTQYYFRVTAGNAFGQSAASDELSVTPQALVPGAPTNLSLTAGDAQVAASWSAVTGATGYTLYYSTSSLAATTDFTSVSSATASGGATTATVSGLSNGTQYYFRVTAGNASGESIASAQASATPQVPAAGAPTNLSLTAGDTQVAASWNAVSGATGYTLYYSQSSFTSLTATGVTPVRNLTGTSRTVSELTNGRRYYFRVTATRAGGESAASNEASATPQIPAGTVFRDALSGGGQGPQMVVLASGRFSQGAPLSQTGSDTDERPVRTVTISRRIAMSRYEITFEDYDRFVAADSSRSRPSDWGWGRGSRPVINVNWNQARAYAAWLSIQTGKSYRLPTESEWEYAARAGTSSRYSWGDSITCSQANYGNSAFILSQCNTSRDFSLARSVAVGSFPANAFGLYDMHGNVVEWVEDCYVNTYTGAPTDGSARTSGCGTNRVLRGGSWASSAPVLTASNRNRSLPTSRNQFTGMRLVQDLNPSAPGGPNNLSLTAGNAQVTASWDTVRGATGYTLYYSQSSFTSLTASGVTSVPNLTGTSHTVTELTNGTQYYFRVTARNAGGESAASSEASATPQAPPGAPGGLSLSVGDEQVEVSWMAVSGATEYTVYYSQSSISDITASGVRSMNATNTSATVTSLTNGTQYYFRVTATSAGGESAASTEASATPQVPVPGVPGGLSLSAGDEQVEVSWTAVNGATRYTVYYSQSSISDISASGVRSMNATNTSATVTSLTNGTQYYFKVTATNAGGEGAASTEASATPQVPVPGAPTGLSLTAGNGQVEVSWTAVNGATRYTVYYSQSTISDISASSVRSMNATNTSATVTGLTNGTQYYVRVTATNAGGEGAASSEVSVTPQVPAQGAPIGVSVTVGNARVAVRWTVVSGATGYTVYYSQSPISDIRGSGVRSMNATGTSATVSGLTNGTQYYVRVTATSTGGESAASNEASTTPQQIPAGTVFRDFLSGGGQGPQMVALPTGSFSMGSPSTEANRDSDEGPVRTVTISKRIAMSRYEITFADYDRFADAHSSRSRPADQGWGRGTRPVINVNWNEARAYAAWLSAQTGQSYRLPSEAEWEYAARAGTTTAYSFGNSITCSQASYGRFSGGSCNTGSNASLARTMAAGSFAANAFGLYDMHGNVEEWVEDCYVNTYTGAPSDGSARTRTTGCGTATRGIMRGGSWDANAQFLRSAYRGLRGLTDRSNDGGMRLVQDLNPSAPVAPTNLSLTAGNAQVEASWNAVSGATSYTLYYSESSISTLTAAGVTRVANVTSPHTVTSLTNGTQYYFRVTATNPGGESAASTEASATPQVPAPGAPTNLSLTAGNAQVEASWNAVSGATSYTLYYSESSISTLTAAGVTRVANVTSPHTVTSLTNGTQYYVRVTATSAGGESAASTEASATPQVPAPGAPTNLSLTAGNAQVEASWNAVSGATSYTLYYSESSISTLTAAGVTRVANVTSPHTVTSLTNGTQYYFRVTATSAGGESAASTEQSATPQVSAPGAPTNLSLTAGNAQVEASWSAVSGATSYTLYYSESSISTLTAAGVTRVANVTSPHTVTSLTNGTQYYFRVTATNAGGEGAASSEASATPQVPAPGAPTNLSLTAGNAQVEASWSAVSGATSYTLYYSTASFTSLTASGVTSVPSLTGTSHTVTTLTNGTQYYFKVTATNARGESAASTEQSATPQVPVAGTPTNLSLTAGNAQVEASWNAVSGATSYTLYYSESSISTLTAAGVTRVANVTSPHTVTSLTNGTQYYVRVTATSAGGESAASTEAFATPQVPVPGVPGGLSLSAGDEQVEVSWTAVNGATRYTVYYSQSSISDISASGVRSMNATNTSATVTSLTNGTQYYFRVTATSAGGESAASTEQSATPQVSAPGAPTNLSLTAGNAQVEASWNAVSGATSYTLYYSESSISTLTAAGVTRVANVTSPHTVTSLTNGTQYYFRVTATSAGGESAASTEQSATPQVPAPGAPTNLSLTAGNAQVEASWNAVSGATSYTLYYSESLISTLTAAGVTRVANVTSPHTVTSLTNGTLYYFKVTATNAGGEGAASSEASATPQVPAPGAPTNLSLTAGNAQVAVSWTAVNGATRYTVYYSQSSISDITASGVRSVSATGTSTTVTRLTNGAQYYFKVTATNARGESAASTEQSATPQVPVAGTPTNLSLTAGNAQVEASWNAVSGATSYTLYYSESSISTLTAAGVTRVANVTSPHTVTSLTNGTQYYVRVTATSAGGESAASTEAFATPQVPVPGVPGGLSLSAGDEQVEVSWTAVNGATRYTVYYSQSSISDISASGVRSMNATNTSATVTSLTNGTQYYFRVTATNAGGESAASSEESATPQVPALGVPTGLSLTAGNAQVVVSWTAVSGAGSYTLYYSESPISDITAATGVTRVANLTGTSRTVSGLTNGTQYYFRVTASNAGGESAASSEASATPQVPVPGVPGGLSLSAGDEQVEVSWTAVSGATSYTLYYFTASISDLNAAGVRSMNATGTSTTVPGLTNGTRYYFKVTATNAGGEGAASTEQSATPQVSAPGVPIGLTFTAGNARVAASWTTVSDVTSYTLYYSTASISTLTAAGVTRVANVTSPHTVTSLINDTQYYFRVTATNAHGEGTASTEASATPQAPVSGAPSGLKVTAGNARVAASWTAVSGATRYTVYYSQSPISDISASSVRSVGTTNISATVTGLTNGTRYYVRVTATSTGGESAASSEASTTPQQIPVGTVFRDTLTLSGGGQGPQMVVLPTGSFRMGSPATEANRGSNEGPVRTVTLSKRIAIGRYEVTFADYDRFADAHRSRRRPWDQRWGRGTRPVINVNWNQARAYAAWLSAQTGRSYRLPSEAEWEYAARAGTTTRYSWGDSITCSQANYSRSRPPISNGSCNTGRNASLARTVEVGSFAANPFGLYDMHGNVWEWVEDCFVNTYTGAPTDGSARISTTGCGRRVVRGGAWAANAQNLRSAFRGASFSFSGFIGVGFRLVQDLNPSLPSAPTNLSLTAGDAQVAASWNTVPGATGYTLYYSQASFTSLTAQGVTAVPNLTTTSHTVTGLTNGTRYYVRVIATNLAGRSAASTEASATLQAPTAPTGLSLTASLSAGNAQVEVEVSWTAVTGATRYTVYFSTSPISDITASSVISQRALRTTTTVRGLTPDTQYYFRVTATNAFGEGAASTEVPVTTLQLPAPGAPTGLSLTAAFNGRVTVGWMFMTNATYYTVYYSTSPISDITASSVRSQRAFRTTTTVRELTNDTQYYFRVTAGNAGGESVASSEQSATPRAARPGTPTGLSVTAPVVNYGRGTLTVSWTPASGGAPATHYTVYYSTSPISDITASSVRSRRASRTTTTVSGLTNGTQYYFRVTATNASGESAASSEQSATPQLPPAPDAPTGLSLTAAINSQVTVSWTAASGASLLHYTVYYSTSPISDITASSVRSQQAFRTTTTVRGLTNGTQYYFRVTATNAGGESAASSEQSTTPRAVPPGTPTGLSLTAAINGRVTVSWTAASASGAPATSYTVYYSTSPISDITASSVSSRRTFRATTTTTVTGLTNGTQYYFRVTATNGGGESAASSEKSTTLRAVRPDTPTGLSVTAGIGQLDVSWTAVTGAWRYTVYYSTSPISDITASGVRSRRVSFRSGTRVTVTGLTDGTQYYFRVTATNGGGESAASSEVSATTQLPPTPDTPTGLSVTAGIGRLDVSWTAVTGAWRYTVYYSTSPISDITASSVRSQRASRTTTTVRGLTNDTRYYVRVTAISPAGREGAPSSEVSATTQALPAPTGVSVTAGNRRLDVSWTAVSGATEYTVYYSTSPISDITASSVRSQRASRTTTVRGLTNDTRYYVKVTASNAGGESAPSSEESATPQAPPGPTGVSVTAGNSQVDVSWAAVSGARSYTVYYSTSPISDIKASSVTSSIRLYSTTTYTVYSLTNGTRYYVRVTAHNDDGESAPSSEESATPQAPPGPTGVSVTAGNRRVTVSWTAVSGARSYTVYYSTSPISDITASSVRSQRASRTTTTVRGLTNDTRYYVRVTASNASGESAPSSEESATPQAPPGPTGVSVTAGNRRMTVSWTAVSGARSYTVYYSTSPISDITASSVRSVRTTGTTRIVYSLTNDTRYYVRVTASNASGESAPSSEESATPQLPPKPAAPTGVSVTAGNRRVTVSWTAVSGARSYTVYYSTSPISDITASSVRSVRTTGTTRIVYSLTNDTRYYVRVTASNASGESAPSSEESATPQLPPKPAAPTGVSVTAGNRRVTVSWTAVSGARSYTVYYSTSPISDITASSVRSVRTTGTTRIVYSLTNDTSYYVRVTASNASGESAPSSEESATPQS